MWLLADHPSVSAGTPALQQESATSNTDRGRREGRGTAKVGDDSDLENLGFDEL